MNERIKKIRKELNYTQEKFSAEIGLSRNFIAQVENGSKVPSERTIKDICREFNVNENWLRTGDGEMYMPISKDEQITEFLADVLKTEEEDFKRRLVSALARLDDSGWDNLEKFLDMICGNK